jgi:hypothetical protein
MMNVIDQRMVKTPTGEDYLEASIIEMPGRRRPVLKIEPVHNVPLRPIHFDAGACRELSKALAELADVMDERGGR